MFFFFLFSNTSVSPPFSISHFEINLTRLNWAENQPFSFDSHAAFIERGKVVIQLIYCITFSCPKKQNYMKIGLTLLLSA